MRPLSDYTFSDWKRLRPVTQTMKTWRYQWINRSYVRRMPKTGDVDFLRRSITGRDVLVTIAFNDPEVIAWQAELLSFYVPRALYIVADNSSDDKAAAGVAEACNLYTIPYFRLPANPWHSFSRSHGIAMNWAWHNILRPGAPRAFGFIDDDLFPTAPDDPFAPLATQNFFGLVREFGPRWFLWAGFCMFRYDAVKAEPLDFGQDWFLGLDTGGANWSGIYSRVERDTLREARSRFVPYKAGIDVSDGPMQWCDSWIHEVGVMGDRGLAADKRRVLSAILSPHLSAARISQTNGASNHSTN